MDPVEIIAPVIIIAILVLFLRHLNKTKEEANFIVCPNPNCGYRGSGKPAGSKSGCLLIILLCLGIIPGLIYLLFFGKSGIICPRCGIRIR